MPRRIDSPSNPILARARSLRDSRRRRWTEWAFLVEGPRYIADFLAAGLIPEVLLLADAFSADSPLRRWDHVAVADRALVDVSATEHSQGAIALFPFPRLGIRTSSPSLVLVVDRVQDPGNAGTLIRSAAASGADAVWFTPGAADPFNPKVIRAAAAAHVAIALGVGPIDYLDELDLRVVVADNSPSATTLDDVDWSIPSLLVLGNEGAGPSAAALGRADLSVAIPIAASVESLNAGVAGSVILFEIARQRRSGLRPTPP